MQRFHNNDLCLSYDSKMTDTLVWLYSISSIVIMGNGLLWYLKVSLKYVEGEICIYYCVCGRDPA